MEAFAASPSEQELKSERVEKKICADLDSPFYVPKPASMAPVRFPCVMVLSLRSAEILRTLGASRLSKKISGCLN